MYLLFIAKYLTMIYAIIEYIIKGVNDMNKKIGVFDSGLGGLSILKELIKHLPNEDYLFYGDSINNPYGDKSDEELLTITSHIVDYLLDNDCKIIVIACNTATTSCMKKLREKYPNTIFVGTVPAIKIAYDNNYKNTLVLATQYTIKSKRVKELIHDYKNSNQEITLISGDNLAYLIDTDDKNKIVEFLNKKLSVYKDADSLVLGCTHYSLIKKEIQEVLPNTALLDGCLGISLEVKHQLEKHQLLNLSKKRGRIIIENSKGQNLIDKSYEILEK